MKSNELKNLNSELKECFLNAGKRAMHLRDVGLKTEVKNDNTPVTNGDLEVNEILTKKIKELVETETGIEDISLKKRTQPYVEARVLYSNLALKHTKLSCKRIGEEINRDHSSVVHHKKVFII